MATLSQTLQQMTPVSFAQNTSLAQSWMSEQVGGVNSINASSLLKDTERLVTSIEIGKMYLFTYDAKTKNLPYHDRFPLIFPFNTAKGGFYGINMHYLPHMMRAKLMDALLSLANNTLMNDTTKLKMSYEVLNGASKFGYFKPCVKHYLNSQVKSRFLSVPSHQWKTALFLPLEQFVGATKQQVHRDSKRIIQGR